VVEKSTTLFIASCKLVKRKRMLRLSAFVVYICCFFDIRITYEKTGTMIGDMLQDALKIRVILN